MDFKTKVQSMTGKEIVQAMIDGLKKEHVKIRMNTFGEIKGGICFGCAATNAICEISGFIPKYEEDFYPDGAPGGINPDKLMVESTFLNRFESALNALRLGDIDGYNKCAQDISLATLPLSNTILPPLSTENYKNILVSYQTYADSL